jgi:hypothetical protein
MTTKKENIWVTQHPDGGCQKKKENSERSSGKYPTQKEAINSAVEQAKKEGVEVIVQGKDGKIRSKDSYGNDPNPPKDKEH